MSFNAKNRAGFFRIIHAGVLANRMLGLPKSYVGEFSNNASNVAHLKTPKGKVWSVQVKKANGGIYLHNGLHQFMEQYSISVGHVLFFSYLGSSQFCVVICDMSGSEIHYNDDSSASEEQNHGRVPSVPKEEEDLSVDTSSLGTLQAAQALKLTHPSFTVTIMPSYVHYLPIPKTFTDRNFSEEVQSARLANSSGRTWEVRCYQKSGGFYHLGKGWRDFGKEMQLKEGNVCVFEMIKIKTNNILLKVHIFQADQDGPCKKQ